MQSKSLQVLKFFNFSEVEPLPTVRVIASAFRSRGLLQECHPSFLNFRTNELQVSIKNLFWTRLCTWYWFWYNVAGDNNSLEDDRNTILLKVTYMTEHIPLYEIYLHVMKEIRKELTDLVYANAKDLFQSGKI